MAHHATVRLDVVLIILLIAIVAEGAPQPKAMKVKFQDKKFNKCYHKDLYCPKACLRTCVVDCKKCKAVVRHRILHHLHATLHLLLQRVTTTRRLLPRLTLHLHLPLQLFLVPHLQIPLHLCCPLLLLHHHHQALLLPHRHHHSLLLPHHHRCPLHLYHLLPIFLHHLLHRRPPGEKRVKCKNKNYPHCYGLEVSCPSGCPEQCEVDCVTCSPVCNCKKPGPVCQDPRLLVVQSQGILVNNHKLFIGAKPTSTWNDTMDRLTLVVDGEPISLLDDEGSYWESKGLSITRSKNTNAVEIEAEGNFKIKAVVVPIREKESGGLHKAAVSDREKSKYANTMNCGSGMDGRGVVCKR
ncbi:hypothetical protein M0R45_016557 [Rubus argutus]|uniref:Uncharacterized protein n=1 Tax=Rubus argutus TaxID=59490 RepID=A0AAW1XTX9_RUBAR